jgi:predicted murein hydrolase (TIGR00659 family)
MMAVFDNLGQAILTDPLFGLISTLAAYQFGIWFQRLCGGYVLLNPLLIAVILLVALLRVADIPYEHYMQGGRLIAFLLGPATVALALPLYDNLKSIRHAAMAIFPAVIIGSLTTCLSAMLIGHWLGASRPVVLSLGAHSATTPVAMGITEQLGGEPSLAAAFTLLTGLAGVILFTPVMSMIRVKDWRARGLGIGTAAHGLGTARMLQLNETAGAYGGIALGLGALITAVIVPLLVRYGFAS